MLYVWKERNQLRNQTRNLLLKLKMARQRAFFSPKEAAAGTESIGYVRGE
jgi:hypothetical protein